MIFVPMKIELLTSDGRFAHEPDQRAGSLEDPNEP